MSLDSSVIETHATGAMLPVDGLERAVHSAGSVKPKIEEIAAKDLTAGQQSLIYSLVLRTLSDTLKSDYFADITAKKAVIYYVGNFEGVAITYMTEYGNLLDILAVENPRNGIGSRLFNHVASKSDGRVFCRSQPIRGYRDWYANRTDSIQTFPNVEGTTYDHFFKGMSQAQTDGASELFRNKGSNYEPRTH